MDPPASSLYIPAIVLFLCRDSQPSQQLRSLILSTLFQIVIKMCKIVFKIQISVNVFPFSQYDFFGQMGFLIGKIRQIMKWCIFDRILNKVCVCGVSKR